METVLEFLRYFAIVGICLVTVGVVNEIFKSMEDEDEC